jgi:hypothetical protein
MTTSPLDATDLKMVRVALCYYVRAHELSKRPVPPAAARLAENLEVALSVNGTEVVVPHTELLTTTQTAARLKCSERTARNIAQRVGRKIGRQWFIPADAIATED